MNEHFVGNNPDLILETWHSTHVISKNLIHSIKKTNFVLRIWKKKKSFKYWTANGWFCSFKRTVAQRKKKQLKFVVIEHGEGLMFLRMFWIVFHIFTHLQTAWLSTNTRENGKIHFTFFGVHKHSSFPSFWSKKENSTFLNRNSEKKEEMFGSESIFRGKGHSFYTIEF